VLLFKSDCLTSRPYKLSLFPDMCPFSTKELVVGVPPLSLLGPVFLGLTNECMVGAIKSDSLSDLSEMGCKLQLSFLLLS